MNSYANNYLNQISSRGVAGTINVLGLANRHGDYFQYPLVVDHSTAAQYPLVTVVSTYGAAQTSTGKIFLPTATESYGYDADGDLTSDGRWSTYVGDGESRFVEMRRDTGTQKGAQQRLTFEFDHLGRRIRKAYYTWVSGAWTKHRDTAYLYDGWNLVAELDANNSNATPRMYVCGNDLSGNRTGGGGVGELLWVNNPRAPTTGKTPRPASSSRPLMAMAMWPDSWRRPTRS